MRRIYLDNASTSYPKAPKVAENMFFFTTEIGCNVNRGEYASAYSAAMVVFSLREKLARLFNAPDPKNVIFTANITYSLNMLLKGFLKPGDHVLVSSMEHNGMMRPLRQLEKLGVSFSRAPCNERGELLIEEMPKLLRPNTKAVAMLNASNVCGTLLPAEEIGAFAKQNGLVFILDAAQTAGVFPLDMKKMNIDALAFTGHKSLLGPQGIGGFAVTDKLSGLLEPLVSGGTGSFSDSEEVPALLPDKFEPGTPNLPGIYGLSAAVDYLEETGIDTIRKAEQALTKQFFDGLSSVSGIRILGIDDQFKKAPILSVDFFEKDNAAAAYALESEYGIMTRCGLHCAPNAHKTLLTYPQGSVRFSISHFNTPDEINAAIDAVERIACGK